jgi:hypothetical protein
MRLAFTTFWLLAASLFGGITTPARIDLRIVLDGTRPPKPTLDIMATGPWSLNISTSAAQFLRVDPSWAASVSGTGIARQAFVLTRTPPVGTYFGDIRVTSAAGLDVIPITLQVVGRTLNPRFTTPVNTATSCRQAPNFTGPYPQCDVPGISPVGAAASNVAYADPNFGGFIRMLRSEQTIHAYSSLSAFSASGKYVVVGSTRDQSTMIYSTADRQLVHREVGTNFQGLVWDAFNDDIVYSLRGTSIRAFNLVTRTWSVVVDFNGRFTSISNGGTGDISKDNWLAFVAEAEKMVCAIDLNSRGTYCRSYGDLTASANAWSRIEKVDFAMISKGVDRISGQRYIVLAATPLMAVYALNESAGTLELVSRGPEILGYPGGNGNGICDSGQERCLGSRHGDVFESADGQQWYMTAFDFGQPAERALVAFRLNAQNLGQREELGGGLRKIMMLFPSGSQWLDLHVGCARQASVCAVSLQTTLPSSQGASLSVPPYGGQLLAVYDAGAEIRQLGYHRSIPIKGELSNSYWSTPRACMSPDGRQILFDSNYGRANEQRTFLLDPGFSEY